MSTIILPPDLEGRLAEEARRRGTTPEALAVEALRGLFPAATPAEAASGATLFDFLAGYIGGIAGTAEALSENCGRRFAEGLAEKQHRRQP